MKKHWMRKGIYFISILVVLITLFSCQKNLTKKFTGEYFFTTIRTYYSLNYFETDTIHYYGTISCISKEKLEIQYAPSETNPNRDYIIYPTVTSDGVLIYDDYLSQDPHNIFSGTFVGENEVNFEIGFHGLGSGYIHKVIGVRM